VPLPHSFKVTKSDPHALIWTTSEIRPINRFFGGYNTFSWMEISWRFLFCEQIVGRRRGIEVKFCLEDYYVAGWGLYDYVMSVHRYSSLCMSVAWLAKKPTCCIRILNELYSRVLQSTVLHQQTTIQLILIQLRSLDMNHHRTTVQFIQLLNTQLSQLIRLFTYQNCDAYKSALHTSI
jgi:hypothetical protein